MNGFFAWNRHLFFCYFWVFMPNLVLFISFACTRSDNNHIETHSYLDDQQCLMKEKISLIETIKNSPADCQEKSVPTSPKLYAHFLGQSLDQEEICFDDIIHNKTGTLKCAPGPFEVQKKSTFNDQESCWEFTSLPNYFIWHLDKDNALEETFLITDQSGFPIKAQIVKLQKDNDATLVLFPKTTLKSNSKHYIYLVTKNHESIKTWIQPIIIANN
jgi:hypothetical protein